jgi:ATP-dependent protease ClpP protease subunit
MTLHPVRINGLVIGVPQSFDYFEKMQTRIIEFITRNSSADGDELKNMIMKTDQMTTDIGTVLGGAEAVEKGLIDRVGSLGDALSCLKQMIGKDKFKTENS